MKPDIRPGLCALAIFAFAQPAYAQGAASADQEGQRAQAAEPSSATSEACEKPRKRKYPDSVLIQESFVVDNPPLQVARYRTFQGTMEFLSYIDIIGKKIRAGLLGIMLTMCEVPEIVGKAALLAVNFRPNEDTINANAPDSMV